MAGCFRQRQKDDFRHREALTFFTSALMSDWAQFLIKFLILKRISWCAHDLHVKQRQKHTQMYRFDWIYPWTWSALLETWLDRILIFYLNPILGERLDWPSEAKKKRRWNFTFLCRNFYRSSEELLPEISVNQRIADGLIGWFFREENWDCLSFSLTLERSGGARSVRPRSSSDFRIHSTEAAKPPERDANWGTWDAAFERFAIYIVSRVCLNATIWEGRMDGKPECHAIRVYWHLAHVTLPDWYKRGDFGWNHA